MKACRFPQ
ncbi:hypothetical protein E2C01_102547 [Portunus trituberculatus]|uniref:Uncharacterized protein n=1 Tax=Portunus trituberculatus TaxID=210409 RepID=A0A5B7K8I9_PORTR|nr:hypothetical protein [Portunus trituberculatus]